MKKKYAPKIRMNGFDVDWDEANQTVKIVA